MQQSTGCSAPTGLGDSCHNSLVCWFPSASFLLPRGGLPSSFLASVIINPLGFSDSKKLLCCKAGQKELELDGVRALCFEMRCNAGKGKTLALPAGRGAVQCCLGYSGDKLPIPALGFTEQRGTHVHPCSGLPAVGAAGDRAVSSSGGPEPSLISAPEKNLTGPVPPWRTCSIYPRP